MEAVRTLQQQLKAKEQERAKLTAEIQAKQAAESKLGEEIKDLNTKIQAGMQSLLETTASEKSQAPPVASVAPKPKAQPKASVVPDSGSLLQKTFTTIEEDGEYEAKDRAEQVQQYIEAKESEEAEYLESLYEQSELIFNWPSAFRKGEGGYKNSSISELDTASFQKILQQALADFCKDQHVPAGHLPYLPPTVKKICHFRPWPKSGNAIARVAFQGKVDADRLFDSYDSLARKYLDMKMEEVVEMKDGSTKTIPLKERIYIREVTQHRRDRDHHSDHHSVCPSEGSNVTVEGGQAGQKGKKDLLLAQGIELAVWRSKAQKWFALDSVQKSASQVAKSFGLQEPMASFDVPQPAPEGAICLNFVSYEQAKTFKDKINDHPTGVRSGAAHLTLQWARRKQAPVSTETVAPKAAPKAKAW